MPRPYRTIPPLSQQDIQRFWSHVDKTPGQGPNGSCWEWKASVSDRGYGQFGIGNYPYKTHRLSYFIATGKQPSAYVCHYCDNPLCVNPDCLFIGTPTENMRDMMRKGRQCSGPRRSEIQKRVVRRGDSHYLSKYTDAQWLDILRELKQTKYKTIVNKYGVTLSTIWYRKQQMSHLL